MAIKMRVLVVYPLDSMPTTATAYAGDKISNMFEEKGHQVTRLNALLASKFPFDLQLNLKKADFIAYLGHGGKDRLYGQLPFGVYMPLVSLTDKGKLVASVVFTIACLSGMQLGNSKPSRAYYGSLDYMYVAFPDAEHNWLEDFAETWKIIPEYFADGGDDYYKALELYKQKCTEYINEYKKHPEWKNGEVYADLLVRNRDAYNVFVR